MDLGHVDQGQAGSQLHRIEISRCSLAPVVPLAGRMMLGLQPRPVVPIQLGAVCTAGCCSQAVVRVSPGR